MKGGAQLGALSRKRSELHFREILPASIQEESSPCKPRRGASPEGSSAGNLS